MLSSHFLDGSAEPSVDGVYFHNNTLRNDLYYNRSGTYNMYKVNPEKSFQLFVVTRGGGGAANSTSQTSSNKYGFMGFGFSRYQNWLEDNDIEPYDWITHGTFEGMGHEILHLLGLNHTVRYNGGTPYPSTNQTDYDGCDDTPSPWEMENIYNSNHHPACGWTTWNDLGCSNNWMDYSGATALSPCQKSKLHFGLENGLKPYSICDQVINDIIITNEDQLLYPLIATIGNSISIDPISTITIENESKELYFNDEIVINEGFETIEGAEFETFYTANCPELN